MIKKILILGLVLTLGQTGYGQALEAVKTQAGIAVSQSGEKVLFYQLETKDFEGQYPRANYLHPVYGLDGTELTEDFPKDHLHQRGVFWAWHQLYVKGQSAGDPWECKNVKWDVKSADINQANKKFIQLEVMTDLYSTMYPRAGVSTALVSEHSKVTIHKKKKNYRLIDVELRLTALVQGVEIGGSDNEKGYGGFSVRMKMPDDIQFGAQEGLVEPITNALNAGKWMNVSGSINDDGSKAGIVMVQSKDNPSPNENWIIRKKTSMQNPVWPGQHRVGLSMDNPTILKYRLIVYDGALSAKKIKKLATKF